MTEVHDWGEEPPKDSNEIKDDPVIKKPDDLPWGWQPSEETIRAIQGLDKKSTQKNISPGPNPEDSD